MMSSAISGSPQVKTERRSHVRRKMGGLTYVDLGPLNGGILVDLSRGGLCFQSVAPMSLDPAVLLKFKLPGAVGFIQSYAEFMWLNETGKRGGLRFAGLSAEVREQIGTWVGATEIGTEAPQESDTIHEHSSAELKAVPVPQASNERGVLGANRSSENPVGHQADSVPMQQPEAGEAVLKTAEPAAENPIVRPAANAAFKARAIAEVSPERVANRVHSGMMAASALEWSARAPRIAPSQGSAAGEVTHSKQAPVSHALKPSSPPNRTLNQEWAPQREALASQMLKVGIGAAAGAVLALAFVAGMPWLRIRALATTKGKSAALSLKSEIPEFQVEVADINNRRWILKSEDNTGSPFRAGTQGRATESERSSDVPGNTAAEDSEARRACACSSSKRPASGVPSTELAPIDFRRDHAATGVIDQQSAPGRTDCSRTRSSATPRCEYPGSGSFEACFAGLSCRRFKGHHQGRSTHQGDHWQGWYSHRP